MISSTKNNRILLTMMLLHTTNTTIPEPGDAAVHEPRGEAETCSNPSGGVGQRCCARTVEQDQALDVWCDPQQARAGMCPMSAGQRINALYSACMSQQLVDGRVWPPHASHQLNSKNSARFVHACN